MAKTQPTPKRGRPKRLPDYLPDEVPDSVLTAVDDQRKANELAWATVENALGFWFSWHLFGGSYGLMKLGRKRQWISFKRRQFKDVFKVDVHEFQPEMIPLVHKMRAQPIPE